MKFIVCLLVSICTLSLFSVNLLAVEATEDVAPVRGGTPLTQEELDRTIGRYGEVDEIPENFEFNAAEKKIMAC